MRPSVLQATLALLLAFAAACGTDAAKSVVPPSPPPLAGAEPLEPNVVIRSNAGSLGIPLGLAFEQDGSL